jgi:hypothetical protein
MTTETIDNIEEMSASGTGAVMGAAKSEPDEKDKDVEDKLRSIIRESIRLYAKKKQMLSQEDLQEQKIRQAIRKILLSEKASKDPAPSSTLEGVMRSLLNNIVPQIRIDYMKLQTNEEERQGFKDYFYNAISQTIDVAHDQVNPEDTEKELEEQEKIVFKSDDPDFINGVSDGTDSAEGKQEEEKQDSKNISSYYDRGQNFGETAFNAIKDRIQNAVYSQIVPEEYPEFVKVLNANLQAWFKIWDTNRTEEEPVPEAEPELELGNGGSTDLDLTSPEEEIQEDFEIELE